MTDHLVDRVSKLLAQAENTPNAEEAEAFWAAAQMLATRHSIDLAVARQSTARREQAERIEQRHHDIGRAGQRSLRWHIALFDYIGLVNDVRCSWASNKTNLTALGFPSDHDVVEALYTSLLSQMIAAANAYLASGEHRKSTVWSERQRAFVPVHGSTARAAFYEAYIGTVTRRLRDARDEATREHAAQSPDATGTALALRNKTEEVDAAFRDYSQRVGVRTARAPAAVNAPAARNAGRQAGRDASLSDNAAAQLPA